MVFEVLMVLLFSLVVVMMMNSVSLYWSRDMLCRRWKMTGVRRPRLG
jgi:hypothetical protein